MAIQEVSKIHPRKSRSKKASAQTVMADKIDFKMFCLIFLSLLIVNDSFSLPANDKEEKCNCYDVCEKNFTANSIKDLQRISACQRGCRFHSLVLHTSHDENPAKNFANAKEGCLLSCSESYINPLEVSACNYGCTAIESSKLYESVKSQVPQLSYSFFIEESDVLIHPGEPDPDDSLTDPGLRKQFQKTLVALLDSTPKIPEIHFRNLPIRVEKQEMGRSNFKCPKFYGFDSKLEFHRGKIAIGDFYCLLGIFFSILLFMTIAHYIEKRNLEKYMMESRTMKKQDLEHREPLLKSEFDQEKTSPNQILIASQKLEPCNGYDKFIDGITIVIHEDGENLSINKQNETNTIKM